MLENQQPIKAAAAIECKLKQIKIDTEKQIEHLKS
jgi:hypothetical protein